jgi:cytoskeletal protein CcmA (bactofilin family)
MAAPGGSADARPPGGLARPAASPAEVTATSDWRRSPADPSAAAVPIVLGARSRFEGLLAIPGDGQIDGQLTGDVICRGRLEVGAGARIEGRVEANVLVVLGELQGDAAVGERIELGATARVVGSISAPRVAVAEGCVLRGRCEMPTPGTATDDGSAAVHADPGSGAEPSDGSERPEA